MRFRRGFTQRRCPWTSGFAASLVAIIVIVPTWFLLPGRGNPAGSDAVVVLASLADGRHQRGADLVNEGTAHNFVVSNPLGTTDITGSAFCRGREVPSEAAESWCLLPDPVTTKGEALAVNRLAAEEGWTKVTVVTNRPHTHRVRTIFNDCMDITIAVISIDGVNWKQFPYDVTREIGGFLKYWANTNDRC